MQELRDSVAENVITTAKNSIDELRKSIPDLADVSKDISSIQVQCSRSVPRTILSAEETLTATVPIPMSAAAHINTEAK